MKKIVFLILFISHQTFSQLNSDEKFLLNKSLESIGRIEFDSVSNFNNKIKNKSLRNNINLLNQIIQFSGQTKSSDYFIKNIDTAFTKKENKIIINLIKGYNELFYNTNNPNSFLYFFYAYQESKKLNNKRLYRESLKSILILYTEGILQNNDKYKTYLNEFNATSSTKSDKIEGFIFDMQLSGQAILFGTNSKGINTKTNNILNILKTSSNKNLNFIAAYRIANEHLKSKKINSASDIYKSILEIQNYPFFFKRHKFNSLIKLSHIAFLNSEKDSTFHYLNKAKKYKNNINTLKSDYILKLYESVYQAGFNKYDSAYFSLSTANRLQYKLNFLKSNEVITQSEIYNQTKEKEKQILISEQKRKQNKNLLYASLIFIGLGGVIGYQSLKNSRRKRLLSEQQEELEKQKNITLIKEQEITTINAMVEGQEKERLRISEDLHDNIGSVLATLKLHFENLKLNRKKKHFNQEDLYEKTEGLIDETYKKVRNIAHAKNAGVIANQGLLVALQIMAEKISSANKTQIEVINFGLNKRLENNLEISVFRIIQELTTNIIKHAEAKHATINISLFENILNIIIEDDGKGFDFKNTNLKGGMGLSSIKTRIEHLNGSFTVDATLKKGTTILIDIPLN